MARVIVRLTQRTHIGSGPRAGFRQSTLTHIPGSVLRGAFAAAWLAAHGGAVDPTHRGEFIKLFEGPTIFGPCFAGLPPTPASLRIHKYAPGDQCKTKLFIDDAKPMKPKDASATSCAACHSPLERAKPTSNPFGPSPQPTAGRSTVARSHVTIADDGVAKDSELFMREEINHRNVASFVGRLEGDAVSIRRLSALTTLRIGGRRTTSGRAVATIEPDEQFDPPRVIRVHSPLLVLRLSSPGIFVDSHGAPTSEPDRAELESMLGVPIVDVRKWFRWTEVGGWHAASNLPKHVDRAVDAGATYRIVLGDEPDPAALKSLASGIGLRRHEGFGCVGGSESDPEGWSRG
ncbi:type III-B CRISPR module-associated Cmr3 family protein [Gordonia sp. NPDC062954]|uniref:type III-B CRISPR module-associated Cmr3 family protein n=1 Tax=Gordonia sp. NPDC062954 TaxID=3364003 RepID=UPI0037C8DC3B